MGRPSKYHKDFVRDAVELVRSSPGRPLREIARELGLNHESLRRWVNDAKHADDLATRGGRDRDPSRDELTANERAELSQLRKKVAELEQDKDILRKAAAYFAKEMGR